MPEVIQHCQTQLFSLSKDRPRFSDTLDIIKFLCKDIWAAVWDKQVDNLRTNHRVGTYEPSLFLNDIVLIFVPGCLCSPRQRI